MVLSSSVTSPSQGQLPNIEAVPSRDEFLVAIVEPEDIPAVCQKIRGWKAVVFDVETTGTEPYLGSEVLGVGLASFSGPEEYYYLPVAHQDQMALSPKALVEVWEALGDTPLVGHNVKFDLHFLVKLGFPYADGKLFDTMVMARLCETDERPDLSLKGQAKKRLAYKYSSEKIVLAKTMAGFTCQEVAFYCGEDLYCTKHLYTHFKWLFDGGLRDLFSMEAHLTRVLFRMEQCGWHFDREYLDVLNKRIPEITKESLATLRREIGRSEFNPDSHLQMCELMEELQIEPLAHSFKTQKPSWDRKVLEQIDHPVAQQICRIRALEHITSGLLAILNRYVEYGHPELHGTYQNWGTVTGRLSSKDPNKQNVNKGWLQLSEKGKLQWTEEGPEKEISLRKLFVPHEGYALVVVDYQQIEMFVLGLYLQDKVFDRWLASEDVHGATAMDVWGADPKRGDWPEMRKRGKQLNFGIVFGQGVALTAQILGASIEQAKKWRDQYFKRIPGYGRFVGAIRQRLQDHGQVRSRHFRRIYSQPEERAYKLVNFIVQGTTADFVKHRLCAVADYCTRQGIRIWGNTHDENIFEIPLAILAKVVPVLVAILEQHPDFPRRLPVEVKWSTKSLGELEPLEL